MKLEKIFSKRFFFVNVTIYKFNNETLNVLLYSDFLQILYGLTMKPKVQKLYTTRLIKKNRKFKQQTQKKYKNAIKQK